MTYRTEQDKINRKEANLRYYKLEENKEQKREYMKAYRARDYVKAKYHEYYIVNKMQWGEITKAKQRKKNNWGGFRIKSEDIARNHYEWCKANGYDSSWYKNDTLNAVNSERFVNDAKK
jgi:hypothetical protein